MTEGLSREQILKILKEAAEKEPVVSENESDNQPILTPEAQKQQKKSDEENNPTLKKKGGLTIPEKPKKKR